MPSSTPNRPGSPRRSWHDRYERAMTFGDRVADRVASFAGSWLFVLIHAVWFSAWMLLKVEPFPFGLLTLIVSLEAIFLSTFIIMSGNRSGARDRVQAQHDYETNLEAERRIESVQMDLARMEAEKLDAIRDGVQALLARPIP